MNASQSVRVILGDGQPPHHEGETTMAELTHVDREGAERQRWEVLQFRFTLAVTFIVLLVALAFRELFRLTGLSAATSSGPRRGLFRAAWEKANACVGMAFSSR